METQTYTTDRNVMPRRITAAGVKQANDTLARTRQTKADGTVNENYTLQVEEIKALESHFAAWQACKDWAATKGYTLNDRAIKTTEGYMQPLMIFVRKDASGKLTGYNKPEVIWASYVDSLQVTA